MKEGMSCPPRYHPVHVACHLTRRRSWKMAFGLTASEAPDLTTIRVAGYLGDAMAAYSRGKR